MSFFDQLISVFQGAKTVHEPEEDLALAKAVILIEIAKYDEDFAEKERQCIHHLLESEFRLSPSEVNQLMDEASKYRDQNPDIFYSTRRVNELLSVEEKHDFMVQVWKVVLADWKIDFSEDVLTRNLIQLLRLDRKAWAMTRDRAKLELGE